MPHAPKRALVADDDEATGRLVREALLLEGYRVEVRANGRDALDRLRAAPPVDLAVLDVVMPGLTGVEVLRSLRAAGGNVPAIVMSSFLSDEVRRICGSLGRVRLLEKPFRLEDLRRAVSELLRPLSC
ncbi:MAG TPA: response regulator [Planctomycetota bacterium]|jgi:CheY-like chemotaxis protein|nr:response regulator [Planctomycetota bacterium]